MLSEYVLWHGDMLTTLMTAMLCAHLLILQTCMETC